MKLNIVFIAVVALSLASIASANKHIQCSTVSGGIGGSLVTHEEDLIVTRFSAQLQKGFIVCEDCHSNKMIKKITFGESLTKLVDVDTDEECNPIECILDDFQEATWDEPNCPSCNCVCEETQCGDCDCPSADCQCDLPACSTHECESRCGNCVCGEVECAQAICNEPECGECECAEITCPEPSCENECPDCQCEPTTVNQECPCPACEQEQNCNCPDVVAAPQQICSNDPKACTNSDEIVVYNDDQLCVYSGKNSDSVVQVFYQDNSNGSMTIKSEKVTVAANEKTCVEYAKADAVCMCVVEDRPTEYY